MLTSTGRMRTGHTVLIATVMGLIVASPALAQQDPAKAATPGGSYSTLRPQQTRLVDDWFTRLSAVIQRPIDPAEGYDNLPLSTRTTFNAVTHALLMTKLTDSAGVSLAESSIALVNKVDDVSGQIMGSKSDQQFRIYAQMKPGVLQLLIRSREFSRSADNAVYHKGYPLSFRSTGGTPSIQFSLTRDGLKGDIDVDYRSSKFPVALLNGHLTASNSDIRAGTNDARHNQQWSGMQNWWRNLLGWPWAETARVGEESERLMPTTPRLKGGKPADAVFDFLSSWMVEQQPQTSIAYFSDQSYACVDLDDKLTVDRGVVRFILVQRMIAANAEIGKIASLADATAGVVLDSERMKVIEQPHQSAFVLYDVREDLAEEFKCANQSEASLASAKALKSNAFGKYVGAMFSIRSKSKTGARLVATLWQLEGGYWKLISYDLDPVIDRSALPSLRAAPDAEAPPDHVPGDKDMVKAASTFLKEWLVKKDIAKALEFVAASCLACVNVYRPDDVPALSTAEEARELLKKGMTRAAQATGPVKRLDGAIVAPAVQLQALKLVKHSDDAAFVIAALPESMGAAADCARRRPDGDPDFNDAAPTGYGTYYAAGFNVRNGSEDPATLWTVWSRVNGAWKIASYALFSP